MGITLTDDQAAALEAFCEASDLTTTGCWPAIATSMKEQGVDDPETALYEARNALRGQ